VRLKVHLEAFAEAAVQVDGQRVGLPLTPGCVTRLVTRVSSFGVLTTLQNNLVTTEKCQPCQRRDAHDGAVDLDQLVAGPRAPVAAHQHAPRDAHA
jgi:hypothetical protein